MHRSARWGLLAVGTLAAGLLPAVTVESPLPASEAVPASQAADKFKPTPHPPIRIVLGEAGFATTTGRDGTLECLPGDLPVKLQPGAITVTDTTIQLDYGPQDDVKAVIIKDFTVDTALMSTSARHGNQLGVPDVEFDKGFIGVTDTFDGTGVEAKLCVTTPPPPPR